MATTNLLGIDIGSTTIRGVEVTHTKDGPIVHGFGEVLLAPGTVQGGVIQDERAVTMALRQLRAVAKFHSRVAVLGLTNPQVVVREMSIANLPAKSMKTSLPFQVKDMLPLPVERSVLDFLPMEDAKGHDTVRGLLVAAPKEPVLTAVHAVEKAGLHVLGVDLASFALLRATSRLDDQVEGIVNIGAQATTVLVHERGEPLIVRTIPRGGAELTTALSSRLGLSPNEAEALKREVGLVADERPEVAEVVKDAIRPLLNEIRGSFAYLTTGNRQVDVARLALSGGGALLPGLIEALAGQFGLDVVLADPLVRIRPCGHNHPHNLPEVRWTAAVSLGLTLAAA